MKKNQRPQKNAGKVSAQPKVHPDYTPEDIQCIYSASKAAKRLAKQAAAINRTRNELNHLECFQMDLDGIEPPETLMPEPVLPESGSAADRLMKMLVERQAVTIFEFSKLDKEGKQDFRLSAAAFDLNELFWDVRTYKHTTKRSRGKVSHYYLTPDKKQAYYRLRNGG